MPCARVLVNRLLTCTDRYAHAYTSNQDTAPPDVYIHSDRSRRPDREWENNNSAQLTL